MVPRLVVGHGVNRPEPGIENEAGRAFDATGTAETVVDVIRLRAALFVTIPVRIGISRTNGRTHQVSHEVRERKREQEYHRDEDETPVLFAEHAVVYSTPSLDERQPVAATH